MPLDLPFPGCRIPQKYQDIISYTKDLCDFIQSYRFLINIHVVDFLTEDQWLLLEPDWRQALSPKEKEEDSDEWMSTLIHISTAADLTKPFQMEPTWPSSLRDFIEKTRSLSLCRTSNLGDSLARLIDIHIKPGMTEKKMHEVERMGSLIDKVADNGNIRHVVDLGAGQGYLSRTMAFQYGLNVTAVDGSKVQTCGAKRFDDIAVKGFRDKQHLIRHITDLFTPENAADILGSVQSQQNGINDSYRNDSDLDNDKSTSEPRPWLMCGLHACGDLSTMMLRLFTQRPEIQALVNVGCCYHFLTHRADDGNSVEEAVTAGFPMSSHLKNYQLGSMACMLACQAPSRWLEKRESSIKAYEHHFFRCLLQWIMVEKGLISATEKAPVIGRLNKKRDFDSFSVYVKAALNRLGYSAEAIQEDEASTYYHRFKTCAQVDKQIAILWTVRALLGPVIESLILVDRYLYLEEALAPTSTKSIWLLPLFDDRVSPRNMVFVATK